MAGRLLVAAVLLTVNWTGYVWAVANDRVLETALGYFMAPLATMLLGILVLGEPASRLHRAALGARRRSRRRAHDLVRAPAVDRPDHRRVVEHRTACSSAASTLGPVESLAGETFLLVDPGGGAGARDGRPRRQHPVDGDRLATGCSSPSPASSRPPRCCCSPYAAQRVPFTLLGALQYLVPTINLVLGWAVYGEDMPACGLFGFALVWVGLVLITVDQVGTPASGPRARRRPPRAQPDGRQLASTPHAEAAPPPPSLPLLAAAAAVLAGCGGPPSTRDFADQAV